MDLTKTEKFRYLENKTLLFLQIKKFINYTSRATLWQKIVSKTQSKLRYFLLPLLTVVKLLLLIPVINEQLTMAY